MKIKSDNLQDLLIAEEKAVDEAVNKAMRHALLAHKRAGNAVASWENGKVVMIPAEKIPVAERNRGGGR
jgi:endonuclease/exonuclease/phosphatase family metal-dependent hydrolase